MEKEIENINYSFFDYIELYIQKPIVSYFTLGKM